MFEPPQYIEMASASITTTETPLVAVYLIEHIENLLVERELLREECERLKETIAEYKRCFRQGPRDAIDLGSLT